VLPDLVGGVELSIRSLEDRTDGGAELARMLANAEYWLSFDVASFETLLAKSPSPLRELGVAISLRFSDRMLGELSLQEIEEARKSVVPALPDDLRSGIAHGLDTLERAVRTRDTLEELRSKGFLEYNGGKGTPAHALRIMGKSNIAIEGANEKEKRSHVELGKPVVVSATDERGRPLDPPEVESRISAPVMVKDGGGSRTIVFFVPGEYSLRVPGKATGDRKVLAG
jgi:hypothetical protein